MLLPGIKLFQGTKSGLELVSCLIFCIISLRGGEGGGGELVGCTQSRVYGAHAPRLPRFMLLISFSDTLLVVSILDITFRKSMIAI